TRSAIRSKSRARSASSSPRGAMAGEARAERSPSAIHLVISDCGDLLAVMITPGNVDDRKPAGRLARRLFGKLFGDRGYISKELFALLSRAGRAIDHQDQEEYE